MTSHTGRQSPAAHFGAFHSSACGFQVTIPANGAKIDDRADLRTRRERILIDDNREGPQPAGRHAGHSPISAAEVAANVGPAIRTVAMPADTNPSGDIFGGWLMAQMDLAAGNAAARRAAGRCATVAVDAMTFLKPVFVGDEVSLYAEVVSVGRSSLRIAIEAWRRGREGLTAEKVTQAIFTFVAIDAERRPRPVPPETPG